MTVQNKRFFLDRQGQREFVEIRFTRRALEVIQGHSGTLGVMTESKFRSEAELTNTLLVLIGRLLKEGYQEAPSSMMLRADPIVFRAEWLARDYGRRCAMPFFSSRPNFAFSHRGGLPILQSGEAWPVCGRCRNPMRFFLQVR